MKRASITCAMSVRTYSAVSHSAHMRGVSKSVEMAAALDVFYGTSEGSPRAWYEPAGPNSVEAEINTFMQRHYPGTMSGPGVLALSAFVAELIRQRTSS